MRVVIFLYLLMLAHIAFVWPANAATSASEPEQAAGLVETTYLGKKVSLPLLAVAIDAGVEGDLASVTVTQTFANPLPEAVHATYLFPLAAEAAVYAMTMEVGDERVQAVIKEKAEARKTFEQAKQDGHAAALLEQHRPNMYTQDIANLRPGFPVKITLKYVHAVARVDGHYELVVPLIVGPRYEPRGKPSDLPAAPPVFGLHIPESVDKDRVAIRIALQGGMPVQDLESRTHKIAAEWHGANDAIVTLAGGKTIDNKDFVLRWRLGQGGITPGLLAYHDERGGYLSLRIEPPKVPKDDEVMAREMVFLLDCSGSMDGLPIEASKAFMRNALSGLRPGDLFRVIRFSDAATEFSEAPLPATPENIQMGIRYVDTLHGEGGTEMAAGIRQALAVAPVPGTLRIVTFLTDGYIGNEMEIMTLVKRLRGEARLYAFGVGTGVNRYLMDRLGEVGKGFTRYMSPTEDVETVARELASRLDQPVLTDITIDWDGLEVTEQAPAALRDLFAGDALRIQAKYAKSGTYRIKVNGLVRGRKVVLPLDVTLPGGNGGKGEAIALMWARATIDDAMDLASTPHEWREPAVSDEQIQTDVTKLGLAFALATKWTSFVAVSERIANDTPKNAPTLPVPLPQVEGVSEMAYPEVTTGFTGSSTPEPSAWLGLIVTMLGAMVAARAARKEGTCATSL